MTESVFVGVIIFCDATKLKRNNFMFFPSDSILRVSMSPNFLSFFTDSLKWESCCFCL